MQTAKEFAALLVLLAATLGIAYAAISLLPMWCLVAYLAGLGLVGWALWRNSK